MQHACAAKLDERGVGQKEHFCLSFRDDSVLKKNQPVPCGLIWPLCRAPVQPSRT